MTIGHRLLRFAGLDHAAGPRRACTRDDIVIERSALAGFPLWAWHCKACRAAFGFVEDGPRRDVVDVARRHLAGRTVCRPRVVKPRRSRPALWWCPSHPTESGGYRGVAPTIGMANDAAARHALEHDHAPRMEALPR